MRAMITGIALATMCAGCEVMDDNFSSPQEFIGSDTIVDNSNYFIVAREYEEIGWSNVTTTLKYYATNKIDRAICLRLIEKYPTQHTFRFTYNPWVVLQPYERNKLFAEAHTYMTTSKKYPDDVNFLSRALQTSNPEYQANITPEDCTNMSN